jgi:glycosyltransferase involved in cell wall biosynthesis
MNILFVTIAWPDEGRRNLYSDLMDEFIDNGHQVAVLCSRERSLGKQDSFKNENGIDVIRVKTGNIKKSKVLEKAFSLMTLGIHFKRGVRKYLSDKKFDLIIFNTPPITLSGFIKNIKSKYDAPLYLLLKDMWPYGFADFGVIKKGGLAYNYLLSHENKLFALSDHIGCMSPKGVEFVLTNYPDLNHKIIEVCPNSMKIKMKPEQNSKDSSENRIKTKYGIPDDATVFIFSGNLGLGHGLDFLVDSIVKLKNYQKAFFLIGGAGTHFARIKKRIDQEELTNAYMYSYLPDEDFKNLMSICDVGLILLDSKYSYPQFPSRLLGYLNDRLAVLCAVNRETDMGDIVEKYGAGLSVLHGEIDEFINAVKKLSEDTAMVKKMGENGFKLLEDQYSVDRSYEVIMNHYNQVKTIENA